MQNSHTLSTACLAGFFLLGSFPAVNAALVSLGFGNVAAEPGSSTTYSTLGDVWRATNVRLNGGPQMDAIFTFTGATGVTAGNLRFVNEPARGNNMRVRLTGITNAAAFINIRFVNAGTLDNYTGWLSNDQLVTQFSDLDSDPNADRSDFAGAHQSQYVSRYTSDDDVNYGSSLLEFVESPAYATDHTVAIMDQPWMDQGNVFDTAPAAQSVVTAAFYFDTSTSLNPDSSIDIVVGQRHNGGASSDRHIDIDMTPDFAVIPEPSTYAMLIGIAGLAFAAYRRRK